MRHVAVKDDLYRAVVVVQLLRRDAVGVVAMHMAVDADDLLDMGGNRSQIVRYHDDGHFVVELFEQRVKLLLEPVVDEIGRFVQNQQFRIGNQSGSEERRVGKECRL